MRKLSRNTYFLSEFDDICSHKSHKRTVVNGYLLTRVFTKAQDLAVIILFALTYWKTDSLHDIFVTFFPAKHSFLAEKRTML